MSADAGPSDARFEYIVRGSHRSLVPALADHPSPATPEIPSADGLVVVPLSRAEPLLQTPARLAAELGWPLLLLCSRGNQAQRVRRLVDQSHPHVSVVAADLLHRDPLRVVGTWMTDLHPAARQRLDVDTNRKRNLGLAAARMTARSWVLFVDDDILRLGTDTLLHALRHLGATGQAVAGWPAEYFPDNSVVHHARRDVLGLNQDVFISGGAMLVRVQDWEPPGFPPIYNEDWLFLFEPITAGRVVAGPDIGQATYDPYDHPHRAGEQEFGDVLGEGLYHLLHIQEPASTALVPDYWRSVHAKRSKLIQRIIARLRDRLAVVATESERLVLTRELAAIEESRKQLTRATPESLADFIRRWQQDEQLWMAYYAKLPQRDTLKEALIYLGLQESWIVTS